MRKLLVGILVISWLSLNSALAATTLFEVTRSDSPGRSLLLGGSIHLLRQTDFPLPAEFDAALNQASKLVLESDVSPEHQAQLGMRMLALQQLEGDKTLADLLSPALWQRLNTYCKTHQLPLEPLSHAKPFFLSMMLTVQHLQRLGFIAGVDFNLDAQARKSGKAVGALESADDVIALMKSMDTLKPDEVIKGTLDDLDRIEPMLAKLLSAWRDGDLTAIQQQMVAPMKEESPQLYQALLVTRNQRWLPQIEHLFANPEQELVVVGSAHLAGPDGLVSQLLARGYRVSAWQAPNASAPSTHAAQTKTQAAQTPSGRQAVH